MGTNPRRGVADWDMLSALFLLLPLLHAMSPNGLLSLPGKWYRAIWAIWAIWYRAIWAIGDMMDHMALLREFFAPFLDLSPRMAGLEDCESLFAHL